MTRKLTRTELRGIISETVAASHDAHSKMEIAEWWGDDCLMFDGEKYCLDDIIIRENEEIDFTQEFWNSLSSDKLKGLALKSLSSFLNRHRITHIELTGDWSDIIYTKPVSEWLASGEWKKML